MVPGRRGSGSAVLATMTMLAPSAAARFAVARPIPRGAPVMKWVLPLRSAMVSPLSDLGEIRLALLHERRERLLRGRRDQHAAEALGLVGDLLQHRRLLSLLHQPLGLHQAGERLGRELL